MRTKNYKALSITLTGVLSASTALPFGESVNLNRLADANGDMKICGNTLFDVSNTSCSNHD